jgi:hypothetical protein
MTVGCERSDDLSDMQLVQALAGWHGAHTKLALVHLLVRTEAGASLSVSAVASCVERVAARLGLKLLGA